jgi:endoglucanase
MIPHIQAIDPDGIILVGTPGWSSLGLSGDGSPEEIRDNPVEADNIMYTFHFYAADPDGHKDGHRAGVRRAVEMFPIFVTEWGTQSPLMGDGANDFASAQLWIDLMNEFNLSWTSWNYSDDWRSGASFIEGACADNNYSESNLKEAGQWVRERVRENR